MKNITVFLVLLIANVFVFGQHHEHDFSEPDFMLNENIKKEHPEWAEEITKNEKHLEEFTVKYAQWENQNAQRAAEYDYIIPVVFHILHEDGPENITNLEVHDAMRILNEDFKLENSDTSSTIAAFKNLMGDARIEFRLARKDPNGNPTNGIDRIRTSLTNNAGEGSKLNPWPRSTYLNVWIVNSIGSGAAGYTFLPSSAHRMPTRDGIILLYTYFSSERTGRPVRSRALTHEIGHWLNLPHPWGGTNNPGLASNCNDDDGVFDTPNTVGYRSCQLNGVSCGTLDNVQNFMDYSYCATMFTKGQVQRMRAAVNTWVAERNKLVSKENNEKAGVLDLNEAEFVSDKRVVCTNGSITYSDVSAYGAESWSWEFEGGTPKTSNSKNPTVTYSKPGVYKTKLTVSNGTVSKTLDFSEYVQVNRSVGTYIPVVEDFEGEPESEEHVWIPVNEDNDNIHWKKMQGVGSSGNNFLGLRNYDNLLSMVEAVISPAIDMSNVIKPVFSFSVSTAERDASNPDGQFKVYTSTDCGKTWAIKTALSLEALADGKTFTTSFVPQNVKDWKTIELDDFASNERIENLLIKFEVENGNGNNVYIDDINIFGSFASEPFLEFPRNGMDSVSTDIYLDWKSVPFIDEYEVQLSTDAGFSNVIKTSTQTYISEDPKGSDTRFKAEGLAVNTRYYWRVRTKVGTNASGWSDVWSFRTSSSGTGHEFLDGDEFVNSVVQIDQNTEFNVFLFPNPANDRLNVRISNSISTIGSISVVNIYGAEVLSEPVSKRSEITSVDISGLSAGFYMVNVKVSDQIKSSKILIQK